MGVYRLYKAEAPYIDSDVGAVDYAQTADVMYMAHISYPPVKLARYGHTDWRWSEVTFGSKLTAPAGVGATPSMPNSTGAFATISRYVVTNYSDDTGEESVASGIVTASNDLSLSGNYNTIAVPGPSAGVTGQIIYKEQGGVFGYIGTTTETSMVDKQIQPVTSITPPLGYNPFDNSNYPGVVTFHQQRLLWGGSSNVINGVWGSRSAQPENMDKSRPARADDAVSFALLADKVNAITGLCSVEDLLCLTTDSIFAVQGNTNGTLTPTDVNPKRTSGRGARKVKPIVIDTVVFFVTSRGKAIRTLGFSFDVQGYKSDNVTIFAPHLFASSDIQKIVYQEEPYSVLYVLLRDGTLLAFTWEAEQEVWGWSTIETDGTFEDIEVIPESGYDRLYARVRRSFGVFHERMSLPHIEIESACHLDCSYTRTFDTPVTRITGAYHLIGQTVSMIFDGYVAHDLEVSECDGGVDVPQGASASTITVGIRYSGRLETLPFPLTGQGGSNHVNRQQIKDVIVRTVDTRGIEIGTPGTPLEQIEPKDGDEVTELTDVSAVDYRVDVPGNWTDQATVVIEQNEPLPANITAIFAGMLVAND